MSAARSPDVEGILTVCEKVPVLHARCPDKRTWKVCSGPFARREAVAPGSRIILAPRHDGVGALRKVDPAAADMGIISGRGILPSAAGRTVFAGGKVQISACHGRPDAGDIIRAAANCSSFTGDLVMIAAADRGRDPPGLVQIAAADGGIIVSSSVVASTTNGRINRARIIRVSETAADRRPIRVDLDRISVAAADGREVALTEVLEPA